ncbi:hypothetical protein BKI52_42875 [marine bacterium AO1-C]|nr:hypothetical protein BKI52_42875 [marine bacterium AO1-C]
MKKFTLHADKYLEAIYDERLNLVELYWKEATKEMTEAEYRMIVTDIVDLMNRKYQEGVWSSPNWLLDNRDFRFVMSPKLQEWQAKYVFTKTTKTVTQKCAVVMSADFITQFTIEQTFEEHQFTHFRTKYFTDLQQANEWLQE